MSALFDGFSLNVSRLQPILRLRSAIRKWNGDLEY